MRRRPVFIIENRMSDLSNFMGTPQEYHNKLIQVGLTMIFIAMAVYLLFPTLVAQNISSVKTASQSMPAGDLSVVGQPSLPTATVDTILKSLGSPMSGLGKVVIQASQQSNIDDAFALAVWWTETNDGAAGVGLADRNPGSVRGSVGYPSAFDGYTIYPSYSAAISYWFSMVKNIYVNRGFSTVYSISHPYVGTSSSPLWAGKVVALMLKYRGEAPPVPVVVLHGKRVTQPTLYVHTTPTPLIYQAQSQTGKVLTNPTSSLAKQASTPSPLLPPAYEYFIIIFALLLALAIVAGVLLLDKRRTNRNNEASLAKNVIMQDEDKQDENAKDEVMQGGGKPRPYYTQNARPFRRIALYASIQNEYAPNTDALITTAQEMDTGANFRFRRKIFLPSIPVVETAKSSESSCGSNLGRRSTGLLSRYRETYQE